MIVILANPATKEQTQEMQREFDDYVKVVVDVEKEVLAGGGSLHVDCEGGLLKQGSRQGALWGGGIDLANKVVEFNSLTNIKPGQNPSQEILDTGIRRRFEEIVRRLIPMDK